MSFFSYKHSKAPPLRNNLQKATTTEKINTEIQQRSKLA